MFFWGGEEFQPDKYLTDTNLTSIIQVMSTTNLFYLILVVIAKVDTFNDVTVQVPSSMVSW